MSSGSAKRGHNQSPEITIRPFAERDASEVRELFIAVNQLLNPPDLRETFEAYIKQALALLLSRLVDNLVGTGEDRRRDGKAERSRSIEIDYQPNLRGGSTGRSAGGEPLRILST